MLMKIKKILLLLVSALPIFALEATSEEKKSLFERDFSPAEGLVRPQQSKFRKEICLNGLWDFQPVNIPAGYKWNQGVAPELAPADDAKWESAKIKIPSPWNVNDWGGGQDTGEGTNRPYAPSSVYYPSYPKNWIHARMGWLKRDFDLPQSWAGDRVLLHFDAIAGFAQIYVNGKLAGEHFDQHMGATFDISDFVKPGKNELRLGIRHSKLFDKNHPKYKMNATYPAGSNTDDLIGIWQDVFLLAVPQVYVSDVFAKPLVSKGTLEFDVSVSNASKKDFSGALAIAVKEWINGAAPAIKKARSLNLDDGKPLGKRAEIVLDAAEPKWSLSDKIALKIEPVKVNVKAGETKTFTLKASPANALKFWTPDEPNLYMALVALGSGSDTKDLGMARFGWREFTIQGDSFALNGEKIKLLGDIQHPFGPYTTSRRFVYAWYEMIKSFGGNAVRPHAQPWCKYYYDMADEMGIMVLAEDGLFGSSIRPNLTQDETWQRTAAQIERLVKRYRNNPSVVGWSVGNEMFAMSLKHLQLKNFEKFDNVRSREQVKPEDMQDYEQYLKDEAELAKDTELWQEKLLELAKIPGKFDPTRQFVTLDGDGDLNGKLPVWSKHFGDGNRFEEMKRIKAGLNEPKPVIIGEFGATYYGMPNRIYKYAGDVVYKSYAGRNEALAVDLYQNYRDVIKDNVAYFSPSEICWFAIEHLPFGYSNFERLPNLQDGVFPAKPYEEGKPGYQYERIPPYVFTVNPGIDKSLAMIKPLPLYEALKAAIKGQACKWDSYELKINGEPQAFKVPAPAELPQAKFKDATFVGDKNSPLAKQLGKRGVNLGGSNEAFIFVDASTLSDSEVAQLKGKISKNIHNNPDGVVFAFVSGSGFSEAFKKLFGAENMEVFPYRITALNTGDSELAKYFHTSDIYFSEERASDDAKKVALSAMKGDLLKGAKILFEASNIDWSLFDAPEKAKCAQVVLYENMRKPASAVCFEKPLKKGKLVVCSLNYNLDSRRADMMFKTLFRVLGLATSKGEVSADSKAGVHDLLMDGPID